MTGSMSFLSRILREGKNITRPSSLLEWVKVTAEAVIGRSTETLGQLYSYAC